MGAAAEQLKKVLAGLLRIGPGEGRKTALMFGLLLCVVGSFIIGRVARDSLFLSRYSVDYLPYLYIWVAIGVSVQSYLYSRVVDRFRRDRTIKVSIALVLVTTLAARASLIWAGDWFYPVLYVFVELAGALLIIETWTLANDVFNTREAKRLFGIVGAGGVVSAVLVGFSVRGLVRLIGTENLLLFCAGMLVAAFVFVVLLSRACREEILSALTETGHQVRARIALTSDWSRFLANRQLIFVAGLALILGIVITFVDYQFKIAVRFAFLNREDQLTSFLGMFWAITGILSCVIQFFVTGRILERYGVLLALLILPIAMFFGAGTLLMAPALWSATLLKGNEAVFRYTINDATVQLLYLPVPAHFRGRAKALIEGILRPSAIGLSGVLLIWVLPGLPASTLGWWLLFLIIAWVALAIEARQQYYHSLASTLQSRRLHFGEVSGLIPDEAAYRFLRQSLTDPDEQNVLHALDMIPTDSVRNWSEDLTRLITHDSDKIRAKVLKLLCTHGTLKEGPQVHQRLEDPVPEVRAAAVESYCAIGKERAIPAIKRFLNDPDSAVRAATVIGLIRYSGLDGVLSAAERLKGMLESEQSSERTAGARILGAIGVKNFYHPLLSLMVDEVTQVKIEAIKAAGNMGSLELLPALVYRIEDSETRLVASEALAKFGSKAIRLLIRVLDNQNENLATRLAVPSILARIADQQAMDTLLNHIDNPLEEMRDRVLEAIHRARLHKPHLMVALEKTRAAALMEIRNLYHQWSVSFDLDLPPADLLAEALQQRRKHTVRRLFLLLGCFLPVRTVDTIFNNLNAPVQRIRANAIELLDNLLDKELKRHLLPLLDETMTETRKEFARDHYRFTSQSRIKRLTTIIKDPDPWISSCALHTVAKWAQKDLVTQVQERTSSDQALVRETALAVLRQLVPESESRALAEKHINDPAPLVRQYANWLLSSPRSVPAS